MVFYQFYDPLNNVVLSIILAAFPVVLLLVLIATSNTAYDLLGRQYRVGIRFHYIVWESASIIKS